MEGPSVIIIDDELFDRHIPNTTLPERPARTQSIRKALDEANLAFLVWETPIPINLDLLHQTHSETYTDHIFSQIRSCDDGMERIIKGNAEVRVSKASRDAVLCAAGAGVQAVDLVLSGKATSVFCNVRPPGHHAQYNHGNGFCLLNNIVIAARYALAQDETLRVAIVDWDVHHGDGTESFVLTDPDRDRVLFINTQQQYSTIWPGTGKPRVGPEVTNYNFGVSDGDDEVRELFDRHIVPQLTKFAPGLILISCGFDAHQRDTIANLNFSSRIYGWMTTRLLSVCPKIVSMLEGGYDLNAISESSVFHVKALFGVFDDSVPVAVPKRPLVEVVRLSQDYVYSNFNLFNNNNLWAKQHIQRPNDYDVVLGRGATHNWVSPDIPTITLDRADTKWMLKAAHIGLTTRQRSHIFDDEFEQTVAKYGAQFPVLPDGAKGWFVRTERVSLKYGMHGTGPYTDFGSVIESIVTSIEGHECICERHNLDAFKIYFFPWVEIEQEFRVFVYQDRISAISTQHYSEINEWLRNLSDAEIAEQVVYKICDYFDSKLRRWLAPIVGPNYTMDIAFLKDGSVYFIEPNSFGAQYAAGSAAFDWVYEHDALHRESDSHPITVKFTDHE
jgi:acetoin utilization deacetylase AcuC-like enzyme